MRFVGTMAFSLRCIAAASQCHYSSSCSKGVSRVITTRSFSIQSLLLAYNNTSSTQNTNRINEVSMGTLESSTNANRVSNSSNTTKSSSSLPRNTLPKPFLLSLEGNIGAGKSTLMNALRRYSESQTDKQNNAIQHRGNEGIDDTDEAIELSSGVTKDSPCSDPNEKNGRRGKAIDIPFRFVFVDEPLALWNSLCNDDGRNLLETYYSDPTRWAFTFQICALLSRHQSLHSAVADVFVQLDEFAKFHTAAQIQHGLPVPVFVTERCLHTDYECFTKMLHADGHISQLEFSIYERHYNHLRQPHSLAVHSLTSTSLATPLTSVPSLGAILLLETEPDECHRRIVRRSRQGEGGVSVAYLRRLDEYTRGWVRRAEIGVGEDGIERTSVPVLRVHDTDDTTAEIVAQFVKTALAVRASTEGEEKCSA